MQVRQLRFLGALTAALTIYVAAVLRVQQCSTTSESPAELRQNIRPSRSVRIRLEWMGINRCRGSSF